MNELGKTYVCGMCGTEVFVENEGTGTLHCCKEPMKMVVEEDRPWTES